MSRTWKDFLCVLVCVLFVGGGTLASGCSGCGDEPVDSASDAGADAGPDAAPDDVQIPEPDVQPDAGADIDAAIPVSDYDPTLQDLGLPGACEVEIIAPNLEDPTAVARIFVPSFRLSLEDSASHDALRERIHGFVFEHVVPCMSDEYPNVVVFPESMVLPMLMLGTKAAPARSRAGAEEAIAALAPGVSAALAYYGDRFADMELKTANLLLLAVTDQVVRATYDTFGQIAQRYGLYISATVMLPEFEEVTDQAIVARVGDADLGYLDSAYVAVSHEVKSVQLFFRTDGAVIDRTEKTYLNALERDLLALTPGDFIEVRPMVTPWGRTGVVISESALMPDVQERLDDMGAQIIFQPGAHAGGWVTAPSSLSERWAPDSFMLGGWLMAQRSGRGLYNIAPQLTGNFFDLPIDAQVQVVEQTTRNAGSAEFVGQRGISRGNTLIGPWAFPDPSMLDVDLTLEERRAGLRANGERMLPGSEDPMEGQYVEGMWAIDVQLYGDEGIEESVLTHPHTATIDSHVFVVMSSGVPGARALKLTKHDGDRPTPIAMHDYEMEGFDIIRPQVVADSEGHLHIVFEMIGEGENRLYYVLFHATLQRFMSGRVLERAGQWAFRPSLRAVGNQMYLSYIQRTGDANRASFLQDEMITTRVPFVEVEPIEIAPRPASQPGFHANQWDARVAASEEALVVTWIDFHQRQWEVMAAVSIDQGQNWSTPTRVDAVAPGVRAFNANPTVEHIDASRFVIAWTEVADDQPASRISGRLLAVDGASITFEDAPFRVDHGSSFGDWSWRPAIFVHNDLMVDIFYEHLSNGARSIHLRQAPPQGPAYHMPVDMFGGGPGGGGGSTATQQFIATPRNPFGGGTTLVFEQTNIFSPTTTLQTAVSPF